MGNKELIAAIDVGASKCVAVLARKRNSKVEILGCGMQPLRGAVRSGFIIDINAVSSAVEKSLQAARLTAGRPHEAIASVAVSISALLCSSKEVEEDLSPEDQRISEQDTEQLISLIYKRESQSAEKSASSEVIHVLPLSYAVDDLDGLANPCGQIGSKLTVRAHLVAARPLALKNLKSCLYACGAPRLDIVLEQLASAQSVLRARDYEFGPVALVDIGAETTKVAVLKQAREPVYSGALKLGGAELTAELQELFNLSPSKAEELKMFHGCAYTPKAGNATIAVPPVLEQDPDRLIAREDLADCCQHFYDRLLQSLLEETPIMKATGADQVRTIVFTGGGAFIEGLYELARSYAEFEHIRVRVGVPQLAADDEHRGLLSHSKFATAVGLLHFPPEVVQSPEIEQLSTKLISDSLLGGEPRLAATQGLQQQLQHFWQRTRSRLAQKTG